MRTGTRAKAPIKAIKKRTYCAQGEEFKNLHINALPSSTQSLDKKPTETIPEHVPEIKQNGEIPEAGDHIIPSPQLQPQGSPGTKRTSRRYTQNVHRPTSAPPPPPMPGVKASPVHLGHPVGAPPPPPVPTGVPAPPPPPPPPMIGQGPRPAPAEAHPGMAQPTVSPSSTSLTTSESSSSVVSETPMPSAEVDSRSDLLAAIRQGMALKRTQVQEKKKVKEDSNVGMDVASILARRIAVEYSSSEESDTGSDWDDEDE